VSRYIGFENTDFLDSTLALYIMIDGLFLTEKLGRLFYVSNSRCTSSSRAFISLTFSFVFTYYCREKVRSVAYLWLLEQAVHGLIAVKALLTCLPISLSADTYYLLGSPTVSSNALGTFTKCKWSFFSLRNFYFRDMICSPGSI